MEAYDSGAAPFISTPTPSPLPYEDRSGGLTFFGVITILFGCLAALLIPMLVIANTKTNGAGGSPHFFSTITSALPAIGMVSIALIWLGIGSVMARRWARALLLIFAWSWLLIGLKTLIMTTIFSPATLAISVFLTTLGFTTIIPGLWIFFYRSENVKLTCEIRDPHHRWTDTRPLPVIGLALYLCYCAASACFVPFSRESFFPLFGTFIVGWGGIVAHLFMTVTRVVAAWLLFRLDRRGWWLIVIAITLLSISRIITYAQCDVAELYKLMGTPQVEIDQMQKYDLLNGNHILWRAILSDPLLLVFMFYIKKFLPARPVSSPVL